MSRSARPTGDDQLRMLLDTVEKLRASEFPDLSQELVNKVLLRHADSAASEGDLVRDLEKLVDDVLTQGS